MSEQETPATRTTAERLEIAEERERKAAAHRDRLRRVSTAEAEVPGVWATGETSKSKLADTYGVSLATINRILEAAGVPMQRTKQVSDEERKEIAELLRQHTSSLEIQAAYGVSHNTVRNIGLKAGVLKPGERKPQRTDEEYERIQELDQLARQRFGAGIYNLGVGLRTWEAKKKTETEGSPRERQEQELDSQSAGAIQEPQPSVEVSEAPQAGQSTPQESPPLTDDEWVNPDPPTQVPQFDEEPAQNITTPSAPATEDDGFKF